MVYYAFVTEGRVIRIEHNSKCKSEAKAEEIEPQQDMRNASYYVSS